MKVYTQLVLANREHVLCMQMQRCKLHAFRMHGLDYSCGCEQTSTVSPSSTAEGVQLHIGKGCAMWAYV